MLTDRCKNPSKLLLKIQESSFDVKGFIVDVAPSGLEMRLMERLENEYLAGLNPANSLENQCTDGDRLFKCVPSKMTQALKRLFALRAI